MGTFILVGACIDSVAECVQSDLGEQGVINRG